jgi:hypothetical protein
MQHSFLWASFVILAPDWAWRNWFIFNSIAFACGSGTRRTRGN